MSNLTQTNKIIQTLEEKLKYEWDKANKVQGEAHQTLRATALSTYRLLKKEKERMGMK